MCLPHSMGVTRLADRRLNGPASARYSAFPLNSHVSELRLFEPKSLFPGNAVSPAETKAPKRGRRFGEAIAETDPREQPG
jgi:hypothetical protein